MTIKSDALSIETPEDLDEVTLREISPRMESGGIAALKIKTKDGATAILEGMLWKGKFIVPNCSDVRKSMIYQPETITLGIIKMPS